MQTARFSKHRPYSRLADNRQQVRIAENIQLDESDLSLGGVTPFSTSDWPGKLCAVLFMQGCPWRCAYCHNKEFQPHGTSVYTLKDIETFLDARTNLLDGIVLSGGEPLAHRSLMTLVDTVTSRGFELGLHTGGYDTERLAALLPRLDWIGIDYKTTFARYHEIVGGAADQWSKRVRASFELLARSGVPFEVRTTVDERHFDEALLEVCEKELSELGISSWILQVRNDYTEEGAPTVSTSSLKLISDYLSHRPDTRAILRSQ